MKQINFLRGVPADEALEPVAEVFAGEYSKVFQRYGGGIIQYQTPGLSDFNGFIPLKESLARRFKVGGKAQKRVICTNGGMETISLLLKSLPQNSQVATDALTYDRVLLDTARHGHQVVGIPLGKDGTDLDALDEILASNNIKVFYQIAFHHNPTGITTSLTNLETASQLCASRGTLHVLDAAYFELRYDGAQNQFIDLDRFPETTCLVGSFTKTLSPGAKCGFGIFPEGVLESLVPVIANTRLNPNYPTQAVIHQLMESGFYDRHLSFLTDLYGPRMKAANEAFRTHLPDLDVPQLTGGFFVGIWLPGVQDSRAYIEKLGPKGVVLAPAQVFAPGWEQYYTDKYQGVFFRLTFPVFTAEDNERGITLIAETYREMTSQ